MRTFPVLYAAQAAVAAIVTVGFLVVVPGSAAAQVVPSIALSAMPEVDDSGARGAEAVPPIAPIPSLLKTVYPPKPSWKEERMVGAEALYLEGYKLYQAGDRDGARKQFDLALDLVLNNMSEPVNRSSFDKRFEELVRKIYRIDVDMQSEKSQEAPPSYDRAPIDDILSLTFPVDPKLKMKVREEVGATVSQLPLEASDAVLSFINYFSGDRGKRTLVAGMKRAGRYRPMISRILDEEGIPQEFIFLAQAESGFLPRAMSYMAAGGMWQFIRETGARYGLKNDGWVDERFDPEMATRAAARHLRDLYHEFGDWYLAIAAYNCGQGNVDRAVAKTGYADVWELRSRGTLPLETSNYVPIILAMTIMAKNPRNYGIEDVVPEEPLVYDTIDINVLTGLALVSDITGRPVSELKELNPALLRDFAPAGYKLHIPRGARQMLTAGLEMVPADRRATWRAHRVEAGESVALLATRYRTTVASLHSANRIVDQDLNAGSLVVIPAVAPPVAARSVKKPVRAAARSKAQTTARGTRGSAPVKLIAKVAPKPVRKSATVARSVVRRPQS
ncbi:MAG: transglycosylase SLT domain-containing protein [Bryobacteraceae bacterium]